MPAKVYIVDPADVPTNGVENIAVIKKRAGEGLAQLVKELTNL